MKKVLVTGFEPFGGDEVNPSLEIIKRLSGVMIEGGEIVTCQVPVTRYESIDCVLSAIAEHQPSVVINLGVGAGRTAITPERVAINIDDFRIVDNAGNQPIDEPIVAHGSNAYFSTLPIKAITQALQNNGIACEVSNSAGTFVCNHLFYGLQHHLTGQPITQGFIHVPLMKQVDDRTASPSMLLEDMVRGIMLAAEVCLQVEQDIKYESGQIC
jgi:pyroglutamyl-peptidase